MGQVRHPGKRADLLLLAANQLRDERAYEAIETVILNGRALRRSALRPAQ